MSLEHTSMNMDEHQSEENSGEYKDEYHERYVDNDDNQLIPYHNREEDHVREHEENNEKNNGSDKKGGFNWHTFFIVIAVIVCGVAAFFILVDVVKPIANAVGKTLSKGIKSISKWFAWLGIPGVLIAFGGKMAVSYFKNRSDNKSKEESGNQTSGGRTEPSGGGNDNKPEPPNPDPTTVSNLTDSDTRSI